jgi:hypothetical protein
MSKALYHFTDTARLPWIADSGELRPGRNRIGGFPDPDFVWATTSEHGDRTASASREAWHSGATLLVRFTVAPDDFMPWHAVPEVFPQWTPQQAARLEAAAQKKGETDFGKWYCRAEPLPLDRILNCETRTWTKPWQTLPAFVLRRYRQEPAARSILIDGRTYLSLQTSSMNGAAAYKVSVLL